MNGRRFPDLISGTFPQIIWKCWEESRISSTKIVGALAETRTRTLPDTSEERYRLSQFALYEMDCCKISTSMYVEVIRLLKEMAVVNIYSYLEIILQKKDSVYFATRKPKYICYTSCICC
jgi:hypothetical protein